MNDTRLSYSLGSLLTIEQILTCSKKLIKFRPDTIWIPETWGMENFSLLGLVSKENIFSKIGSSIINIYSRSPSLIAMGAATLDTVSNKRLILGLGTSSQPIVENFHGYRFEEPINRMKEYVEIIRLILSGKTINYSGKIFSLKDFSLLIKPPRNTIPIYLAAVNQKMVGTIQEVIVEKESKKSHHQWAGRTMGNSWVVFDKTNESIKDIIKVLITDTRGITLFGQREN